MKKYFLQFYREEDFLYGPDRIVNFNNGLSLVWNQLKEQGEMVWRNVEEETIVATEGIIYASVWYSKSLRLLYKWAQTYSNLEVYVCGPLVLHYGIKLGKELPNFHISNLNAEDLLCNGQISEWNLEVVETEKPIGYSVALVDGYGCYWGKCRYCKITGKLKYRETYTVPVIDSPHKKFIWLHVYSMPPFFMKKLYPQFEKRDDVVYATYIRGDNYSTKALKEILPLLKVDPKYLAFNLGIEYPSDKMLKYMNKGATVKDYLNFIEVCSQNDIRLHFNFILGWKPTDYDDLDSMKYFLDKISLISKPNTITANVYPLTIMPDRKMSEEYTLEDMDICETDYDVYVGLSKQTEKQKIINSEIRKLINSYPFLKVYDVSEKDDKWRKNHLGESEKK
jgi:hypothetical protein